MHYIKFGFTGTQNGMSKEQSHIVNKIFRTSFGDFRLLHGDCIGADKDAHLLARNNKGYIEIFPPIYSSKRAYCKGDAFHDPKPYLERNHDIVNACDLLIVCPNTKKEKLRSGTWATWRYAKKTGTEWIIIYPNGEVKNDCL